MKLKSVFKMHFTPGLLNKSTAFGKFLFRSGSAGQMDSIGRVGLERRLISLTTENMGSGVVLTSAGGAANQFRSKQRQGEFVVTGN